MDLLTYLLTPDEFLFPLMDLLKFWPTCEHFDSCFPGEHRLAGFLLQLFRKRTILGLHYIT